MTKMKRLSFLLIFIYVLKRLYLPMPVWASETAGNSAVLVKTDSSQEVDIRSKQLEEFLNYYDSPMATFSAHIVQMADKYGIDWRLVPAIAGVESTFGKFIPFGSYNAYGWNNGNTRFGSWEESIEVISKSLGEKYYKRGLNTPYKIAPVYCPPSNVWAGKVVSFMEKIDGFEKKAWLKVTPLLM